MEQSRLRFSICSLQDLRRLSRSSMVDEKVTRPHEEEDVVYWNILKREEEINEVTEEMLHHVEHLIEKSLQWESTVAALKKQVLELSQEVEHLQKSLVHWRIHQRERDQYNLKMQHQLLESQRRLTKIQSNTDSLKWHYSLSDDSSLSNSPTRLSNHSFSHHSPCECSSEEKIEVRDEFEPLAKIFGRLLNEKEHKKPSNQSLEKLTDINELNATSALHKRGYQSFNGFSDVLCNQNWRFKPLKFRIEEDAIEEELPQDLPVIMHGLFCDSRNSLAKESLPLYYPSTTLNGYIDLTSSPLSLSSYPSREQFGSNCERLENVNRLRPHQVFTHRHNMFSIFRK